MFPATAVFVLAVVWQAPAGRAVQDASDVSENQTRLSPSAATEIDQIGSGDRTLAVAIPTPVRRAPDQQLTTERGRAYSNLDLSAGPPSAGPAPSPARVADGRDLTVTVPTGPDRCDPQRRPLPVACDRIIEARAGEFRAPTTDPLSAEERLLASQRELRPSSPDLGTATRRLASGEPDDSDAGLAVASVALQDSRPLPAEPAPADAPSSLDEIVAGITTFIVGAAPNP